MRIALSGTPGTGKTSVAQSLHRKGFKIVSLNDLVIREDLILGIDKKRNTKLIDIDAVDRYIQKNIPKKDLVFIEGHASHLLQGVQKVIILRCHPRELVKRLQKKGWNKEKIKENVEAETLDIILCEAAEMQAEKNIFEIDTTHKTIKEINEIILNFVKNNFRPTKTYSIGQIDWSEELLTAVHSSE